jgi:hypothetical protein
MENPGVCTRCWSYDSRCSSKEVSLPQHVGLITKASEKLAVKKEIIGHDNKSLRQTLVIDEQKP